jgi:hypothetical protein
MNTLTAPNPTSSASPKHDPRGGRNLTFGLGPETPAYVKGVYTQRTCSIVVQIQVAQVQIAQIDAAQIENPSEKLMPDFGNRVETPYILGKAKIKSKAKKIRLDINQEYTAQEVARLEGVTG